MRGNLQKAFAQEFRNTRRQLFHALRNNSIPAILHECRQKIVIIDVMFDGSH
jgi:N-acetylmuramoyl-L-alanine amidase